MTAAFRFAFVAALASGAACTVHGTDTPPLSGPSEFALSLTVTATPDSITQDGASQASIAVVARDADGKGVPALSLRLEMAVNGSFQDYGVLSARTIVTGSDGRAAAVYTAPPPPPTLSGGSGSYVNFYVTRIGSNYLTEESIFGPVSAQLRLIPPGPVLPAAGTPTAVFSVTPTPLLAGVAANFDASRSCATASACGSTAGIASFEWNFGDGAYGTGRSTTHSFAAAGTYTVTLTVTNDRGVSASSSQQVTVTAPALPTAGFVFSPLDPVARCCVTFNASPSAAAPGRTLTQYIWDFGDGTTGSGLTLLHEFKNAATYTVILVVIDDLGQKDTASGNVTVK